tara:strand:+ start:344 stop:556 length:213 start_codon:yes stop_codon:yes gene_type:complete
MNRYSSKTASHPGEILREIDLPNIAVNKTAIAASLKTSRQTLYDISNDRRPVSAEMAVRFGKLFGIGLTF